MSLRGRARARRGARRWRRQWHGGPRPRPHGPAAPCPRPAPHSGPGSVELANACQLLTSGFSTFLALL